VRKLALLLMAVSVLAHAEGHGGGEGGGSSGYIKMDVFVINLDGHHFLQFTPQLKPVEPKDEEHIKARLPLLRFEVIKSLIGQDPDKVQSPEFMSAYADRAAGMMNHALGGDYVAAVLFDNWIIQ
jgi:flagellar basal body-associated protein FliL